MVLVMPIEMVGAGHYIFHRVQRDAKPALLPVSEFNLRIGIQRLAKWHKVTVKGNV